MKARAAGGEATTSAAASTSARTRVWRASARRGELVGGVRAIDDPRRFQDAEEEEEEEQVTASANRGGDAVVEDLDGAFAEGTVFRKRVEQPSSEEAWYAGYIREMEGLKSWTTTRKRRRRRMDPAATREKIDVGRKSGGIPELRLTSSPGSVANAVTDRSAKSGG